jgi:hypothetical protein
MLTVLAGFGINVSQDASVAALEQSLGVIGQVLADYGALA